MKRIIIFILFFCIYVASVIATAVFAENLAPEVIIYIGQVKTFPADAPQRVVIGKPEVADVTSVTETDITVAAKATGATTFVFWDKSGEHAFRVRVFAEDMSETKQRIDSILKELNLTKVYTKTIDSEGKVMLLGEVTNPQDRERIDVALGTLKEKITDLIKVKEEEAMVEIDVQVLELNKDATNTLGFTNPLSSTSGITITEVGSPALTGTKWSTLFKVLNLSRDAFSWTLYALVQEGKAKVLSRPRLACLSGKEAELLVGGEKPILTTTVSEGGTGTEVEYKEYGIKLKIKPTVMEKDRIKLALNLEVSEVGEAETLGTATTITARAYPLSKRNASTELFLDNGQIMAIGGLIKQRSEEDITKTPGLGDIPILGLFFRKKVSKVGGGKEQRGDTELFITLTPTIVKGQEVPEEVSKEVALAEKKPSTEPLKSQSLPLELRNYIKAVQNKIMNVVYYPKEAKDASWQGVLKLNISLSSDGSLKDINVVQSSGFKILDDAGQEAVKRAAPFPAFPAQLNLKELRIEIPIVYHKE